MAGTRLTAPGRAWAALSGLLAAGALLAWWLPAKWLDWQPEFAASEPWRAFSGAFVHWSALHLQANLLGTAVVAALGLAARLPWPVAVAWCVAWPLTQCGLLVQPELAHYGGLSGVLHAGVAAAAVWLVATGRGPPRWVGAALLTGLAMKVALEQPWGAALHAGGGWDIAVAPLAHATGAIAGALCSALVLPLVRWPAAAPAPPVRR